MDMRFEIWNVRSLYRVGTLKTVARELAKHNLDLLVAQEVRWVGGGRQPTDDCTFCHGNSANHRLGTGFFIHKGIISAVKRVEFISDRITVLNVHAPNEDKSENIKDNYEELECVQSVHAVWSTT
jgi:hypothetical protein